MKDSYRNPFSGTNASQMDDQSILEYWCDPFSYKLFSNIQENDIYSNPLNTVIVGGRSSGKTMLLRYCSFSVQYLNALKEVKVKSGVINYFIEKGGIGFYKRLDGSALNDFNKKNISIEKRISLFTHYFEMNIGYEYLHAINTLVSGNHLKIHGSIISKISELIGRRDLHSLNECLDHLDKEIKKINDFGIKTPFYDNLEFNADKIFAPTSLSYRIPEILSESIKEFKKINFVLLIDEYENFSLPQQRMVNTLLKFTRPNIKFRLLG